MVKGRESGRERDGGWKKGKKRKKGRGGKRSEARGRGTGMRGPARSGRGRQKGIGELEAWVPRQGTRKVHCSIPLAAIACGVGTHPVFPDSPTRFCAGLRAAEHAQPRKWLMQKSVVALLLRGPRLCLLLLLLRAWSVLRRLGKPLAVPKNAPIRPCRSCVQPTDARDCLCPIGHASQALSRLSHVRKSLPDSVWAHTPSHSSGSF